MLRRVVNFQEKNVNKEFAIFVFEKKPYIFNTFCLLSNSKHKQKPQALKKLFLFYMIFTFCDYCFLFFLKGHQVFCVVMPTFACLHHTIKAGTNTIS